MNHKRNFHKGIRNKRKNIISLILIFFIPIISFISILSLLSNTHLTKTSILGAATQYVTGNTNTSFINSSGYNVVNGIIYKNGSPIVLHGVNWFGFETTNHVVHGLWARNWKGMITQMKSIGINAVRIPFCPAVFTSTDVNSINYSINSDLLNLTSIQIMDKILTEMNAQQMYILLDQHTSDCQNITNLWYTNNYSEVTWINDLKNMAVRYKTLDYFIGMDLKNEPHDTATWGTGNANTDWNSAAERAGSAILSVNPNILIFVEGISQAGNCTGSIYTNWGADLEPFNCFPISQSKIPYNKLILSPHVYGFDVAYQGYFSDASFPQNLPGVMDSWFGFLKDRSFAIVPGEWGGKYGNNGGDPRDVTWQNAFSNYLVSKSICNSFYWSWNPNSGDTGGILQDDWTTLWSNKVQLLKNYYNNCKQNISATPTSTITISTTTPVPTTRLVTVSTVPSTTTVPASCLCSNDICSNTCTFDNGLSNAGFVCKREDAITGNTPTQSDKDNYCKYKFRSVGDTDGDNIINEIDYLYYVRSVNGGNIPSNVFPDATGDGKVSREDRDKIIENLQK